jgi:hypothetical protein
MKKNFFLFNTLFIALVLTVTSCGERNKTTKIEAVTTLNVELNHGEKWEANSETTQGVAKMIVLMDGMKKNPKVEDYQNLSKKMENEFALIFKRCTMKGEAHNQLHNYLIPLKDYIKGLQNNNLEECGKVYQNINNHLEAYGNYFK